MRALKIYAAIVACLLGYGVGGAFAHEIKWGKSEPRQAYFGRCAKGPCVKRIEWAQSKPHRHVGGRIVYDRAYRTGGWAG